jgi:pimeloyl-ACP methyl ester carboxylesterase
MYESHGSSGNGRADIVIVGGLRRAALLKADGFNVSVVQNQTLSLESDVETTHNLLDLQDGPAILVGHSYGGVVITEAGSHERVAGLVYIAAFAPDAGESVNTLIANPPPGAPVPPILPPQDGFLFLDRDKFADSFAADVPAELAAFMADSQVPWGVEALNGTVGEPAWRSKPSWYLVASDDRMIPPLAQRAMSGRAGSTVLEAPGSHAIYVSQPRVTADLIAQAAREGPRRDRAGSPLTRGTRGPALAGPPRV